MLIEEVNEGSKEIRTGLWDGIAKSGGIVLGFSEIVRGNSVIGWVYELRFLNFKGF